MAFDKALGDELLDADLAD